jgi:hypothetical protein
MSAPGSRWGAPRRKVRDSLGDQAAPRDPVPRGDSLPGATLVTRLVSVSELADVGGDAHGTFAWDAPRSV